MTAPHLQITEKDVNPYVLMPGDPGRVIRIAKHLENSKKINVNREFTIYNGAYKGKKITVCSSGMGGPSTAIALHELAELGAKVVIRIGSCGSLQRDMKIGELIIPEQAIRQDGTTDMYAAKDVPAVADSSVFNALISSSKELKLRYYSGTIRSHDSFYTKNTPAIEKFWSKVGVLGSDFESSTIFLVGKIEGLKTGSILNIVSAYGNADAGKDVEKFQKDVQKGVGELSIGENNSIIAALDAIKKL
ncbi:Purine nucleoside phosphorylase [Candidatus Tiddalikarchaeum anstoanum]|nr:Purine nucleoside phosphorylase [Candidatus Tiddalikarchaeum anstoanum]